MVSNNTTVTSFGTSRADPNPPGGDGLTSEMSPDHIKLLLDRGDDPNHLDSHASSHGLTPVHLMLRESYDHIVRLSLNHVVDANAEDGNRNSPLLLAS